MGIVECMDRTGSRPRKAEAIYSATLELLGDHGYDALTMEGIAAKAGVNKTTLYRAWATKGEVLADALVNAPSLEFAVPNTGSFRGDLLEFAREVARLLADPRTQRIIAAIVVAIPGSSATGAAAQAFFVDRLQREQVIFERAVARGEFPAGSEPDPAMVIDLIAGNIWFHALVRDLTVDDAYVKRLVDVVVAGVTH